jgi:hypothetical protein
MDCLDIICLARSRFIYSYAQLGVWTNDLPLSSQKANERDCYAGSGVAVPIGSFDSGSTRVYKIVRSIFGCSFLEWKMKN